MKWRINADTQRKLKSVELFVGHAYPDPASPLAVALQKRRLWQAVLRDPNAIPADLDHLDGKPWTIGYGETYGVKRGDRMTEEQADQRLMVRVAGFAYELDTLLSRSIDTNENQYGAMVMLIYNIGHANFKSSTVLRAHNRGDFAAASRAFSLFNKAKGKVMDGLTKRRAIEAALYLKPVPGLALASLDVTEDADPEPPAPSQVDPESSLVRSPIMLGAGATGVTTALGIASDVSRTVGDVKYSLGDLWPYALAALALVGIGGAIVVGYQRWKQRKDGWA